MQHWLPVTALRRLLAGVADHAEQHLSEVDADLQQSAFLLTEAIEKLGSSFMAIHSAAVEQQAYLDGLIEQNKFSPESLAKLDEFRQRIAQEVNSAVTGLQFHDLTTQLNARTSKRVGGLKVLIRDLADEWEVATEGYAEDEMGILLVSMYEHFNSGSLALEGRLTKSVKQHGMDSGEVDLF